MKAYTYPINYTEMCPYNISVLGTGCIRVNNELNRLTLSKLNSKNHIIGKKIYIIPNGATGVPLSSTIISINKNIINIHPNIKLEPGYNMNSLIGFYDTSYWKTQTVTQTFHNDTDTDRTGRFEGSLLPRLCHVYNTEYAMHIAIDFNVRIYLNGKPEPPNSELWVFIQRSHVDHTTAVVLLPLISDAPGIYEGSWSGPLFSTHMYGGVDVILSYFKFMSVPANTNLTVTMVFTITKIQLYENLCENNLVESPEGSYLRLMVGHAHKMIIDDPYYYP